MKILISFFRFFSFFALLTVVQGSSHHHHHHHHRLSGFRPSKLFVFGDSYADTGNNKKSLASSWKLPYGITFPGKPAGRFSDGRVLTDYVGGSSDTNGFALALFLLVVVEDGGAAVAARDGGLDLAACVKNINGCCGSAMVGCSLGAAGHTSFIGIKSPIPYRWRKYGTKQLRNGMNFAYGGTGVFNTLVLEPNMTTQIDFFQQLIHDGVYNKWDLDSSIAFVSVAGNDYGAFAAKNGTAPTALNLKRIHGMGVRKVAITALQPLGCLPQSTALYSYQQCNDTENTAVNFHNLLLKQAVEKLNNESKDSAFMILDLYSAFLSVFERPGDQPGSSKFENPLKPCCMGVSNAYSCGSMDETGAKKYTVCENPEFTFFWDTVHPSQEGWHAVYSALKASLHQIY
ncbi:hypothetical protein HHK36_011355 [Tetracentron sinense]|uniref:Uncharacterized protein n=1 Tax=Tetracentron sinense TaxID=13715 RepID=A0A834Z818_TETSI|nr:hypothetical protein HHK36_011355 [Tetracentron sinense]